MPTKALHIILVDDDADDLLLFKEVIDELKMRTELTLLNGGQALIDYLEVPENSVPDLIFVDLKMPRIDGMECLKEIRKRPAWANCSVAIYSNFSSETLIEKTFTEGANIYIEKPEDFIHLKNALQKVLQINWQYHTSNLNRSNFLFRI
ncbi:MAG: response regulator [Pricia sp.]